jgi:hypothetical protein
MSSLRGAQRVCRHCEERSGYVVIARSAATKQSTLSLLLFKSCSTLRRGNYCCVRYTTALCFLVKENVYGTDSCCNAYTINGAVPRY